MTSVFLPRSLLEAVLIKALNTRNSTREDWWRDIVVVCSLEGCSLIWLCDLFNIVISRRHSTLVGIIRHMSKQNKWNKSWVWLDVGMPGLVGCRSSASEGGTDNGTAKKLKKLQRHSPQAVCPGILPHPFCHQRSTGGNIRLLNGHLLK